MYLPNLLSSTADRPLRNYAPISGYSTTPLRIRTDVSALPRFVDTSTDYGNIGRDYSRDYVRERPITSENPRDDFIRLSEYPATSAVIGLQPPRLITPVLDADESKSMNQLVPETTADVDRLALYNNSSLGYQRLCFLLSRYPAIAMTIIATWMLWGRGLGLSSVKSNENVCYIVSFVAGAFILSSQVVLTTAHGNSYKKEKILVSFFLILGDLGNCMCDMQNVYPFRNVNETTRTFSANCQFMFLQFHSFYNSFARIIGFG